MTIQDFVAHQTERMAESLAHFIGSTPEDKLAWHPSTAGSAGTRSILEQVGECIGVNRAFASLIRGAELPANVNYMESVPANGQDAQEQLVTSARELSAAVKAMADVDLARAFKHPRGPVVGENLIMMPYRNMAYHAGQLNFIQNLYGDTEFHMPPTWR